MFGYYSPGQGYFGDGPGQTSAVDLGSNAAAGQATTSANLTLALPASAVGQASASAALTISLAGAAAGQAQAGATGIGVGLAGAAAGQAQAGATGIGVGLAGAAVAQASATAAPSLALGVVSASGQASAQAAPSLGLAGAASAQAVSQAAPRLGLTAGASGLASASAALTVPDVFSGGVSAPLGALSGSFSVVVPPPPVPQPVVAPGGGVVHLGGPSTVVRRFGWAVARAPAPSARASAHYVPPVRAVGLALAPTPAADAAAHRVASGTGNGAGVVGRSRARATLQYIAPSAGSGVARTAASALSGTAHVVLPAHARMRSTAPQPLAWFGVVHVAPVCAEGEASPRKELLARAVYDPPFAGARRARGRMHASPVRLAALASAHAPVRVRFGARVVARPAVLVAAGRVDNPSAWEAEELELLGLGEFA